MGVHPVLAELAGVRAALTEAAVSESWWSLSEAQVVVAVGEVLAVRSATEAVTAALVSQVETRGVYTQVAATNATGWLRPPPPQLRALTMSTLTAAPPLTPAAPFPAGAST